jgi:hypothetical protein
MDDLTLILDYVGRSWVPPEVHEAAQRLRRAPRLEVGETGLGRGLVPADDGQYLELRKRPEMNSAQQRFVNPFVAPV